MDSCYTKAIKKSHSHGSFTFLLYCITFTFKLQEETTYYYMYANKNSIDTLKVKMRRCYLKRNVIVSD